MSIKDKYVEQKYLFEKLISAVTEIHEVKDKRVWHLLLNDYFFYAHNNFNIFNKLNTQFDNISLRYYLGKRRSNLFKNRVKNLVSGILNLNKPEFTLPPGNYHYHRTFNNDYSIRIHQFSDYIFGKNKNSGKRKALKKIAESCENEKLKVLINNIPKLYVEYFDYFWSKIQIKNPAQTVFLYEASISMQFLELIIAKSLHEGARVYRFQHGGFYGECLSLNYEIEKTISDRYFTWGFEYDYKDLGIGSPKLLNFVNEYKKAKGESDSSILVPLTVVPDEETSVLKESLNLLIKSFGNKIKIRRRKNPFNPKMFLNSSALDFINSDSYFDDSDSPIFNSIKSSSLVLLTYHPSTTFLECIAVDHPVIAVFGDYDNFHPNYVPYLEKLRIIGVVHYDIETAVKFIDTTDIQNWWRNTMLSSDYLTFKNSFARTSSLQGIYSAITGF